MLQKLFSIINRQLETQGLFIEKGTLIDASIAEAAGGKRSTRNSEASWTKKNNHSYCGYKIHSAMDLGENGLVHHFEMTTAKRHDSRICDELLHGKEKAIFADKGYTGAFQASFCRGLS